MFFVRLGSKHLIDATLYKGFRLDGSVVLATEKGSNEIRQFGLEWTGNPQDYEKDFNRFCECVMLLNTYKEDD